MAVFVGGSEFTPKTHANPYRDRAKSVSFQFRVWSKFWYFIYFTLLFGILGTHNHFSLALSCCFLDVHNNLDIFNNISLIKLISGKSQGKFNKLRRTSWGFIKNKVMYYQYFEWGLSDFKASNLFKNRSGDSVIQFLKNEFYLETFPSIK